MLRVEEQGRFHDGDFIFERRLGGYVVRDGVKSDRFGLLSIAAARDFLKTGKRRGCLGHRELRNHR
jgi:hypothetical protein